MHEVHDMSIWKGHGVPLCMLKAQKFHDGSVLLLGERGRWVGGGGTEDSTNVRQCTVQT